MQKQITRIRRLENCIDDLMIRLPWERCREIVRVLILKIRKIIEVL